MKTSKLDFLQRKIYSGPEDFKQTLNIWRFTDQKIVFTNGCFDLLHLGHIHYLSKAADLGNKLIIGLNSDSSTSAIKGPSRPINDQQSRSSLLAALFFVDAVILFDDPTPFNLIKAIMPDVLVKGADYSIDQIVGSDLVQAKGGEVQTIGFLPGYSSTSIEDRIKSF
jgi:D-glycero-beta-D-manno-heptose 1-phosphate adenylyltransferase